MLKQYSCIINVVFVLVVAFFAAKIANVYIGRALEIQKSIGIMRRAEDSARIDLKKDRNEYEVITDRDIFDSSETQVSEAEGASEEEVDYTPGGEAVRTSLSIKVLAVLVIGEGKDKRSSATIDGGKSGGIDVYGVNDDKSFSPGTRIVQIKPNRIEFVRNGRLEYAELIDEMGESIFGMPKDSTGAVALKSTSGEKESGDAIEKVGEGQYVIDQREIENAIQNLDKLYTQIRAIPNFQGGRVVGMKVLSVRPDSVFAKLGLRRGDVLQRINGIDLDVRRGFEIFGQLKDQKSLTLDLVRGGSNQTVEYEIR